METIVYNILVHSIGQGILLAAAVSLLQLATRSATAAWRYRLLTILLLICVLDTAVYGIGQVIAGMNGSIIPISLPDLQVAHSHLGVPVPVAFWSLLCSITAVAGTYNLAIVWVWLVLALLKTLQVAMGVAGVYELKTSHQYNAPVAIQQLLSDILVRMGITKQVRLAISATAQAPMVIGHFKPLVLLPVALLTNLTIDQTEAVLLHELAHVRRNDFLVNLLQHLTEIIFFYHPAIWWVNKLIRKEREHCCDDDVLARNYIPAHIYAKALLGCQELRQNNTYTLALYGTGRQLQQRVMRIVNKKHHAYSLKTSLAVFAVLTVAALTWCFITPDGAGKITVTHTVVTRSGFVREEVREIYQQPAHPVITAAAAKPAQVLSPAAQQHLADKAAARADSLALVADALQQKAAVDSAVHPPYITDEQVAFLKQELQHDGLINLNQNTSYMLNQDELIVNGCRQPAAVHKRYAEKYIKHPGVAILYNYRSGRTVFG